MKRFIDILITLIFCICSNAHAYAPCGEKSTSTCIDCNVYSTCRSRVGVCWKSVLMAYGEANWDYPDPRCPKAPMPYNEIYIK